MVLLVVDLTHWPLGDVAVISNYYTTYDIRHTLVSNEIVDHSDVVGASSFSTQYLASIDLAKTTARRDEKHLSFGIWCDLY